MRDSGHVVVCTFVKRDGVICIWPPNARRAKNKGVGGKRFVAPEKSAARIRTLTEIDAMFFVRYRMTYICTWNAFSLAVGESHT